MLQHHVIVSVLCLLTAWLAQAQKPAVCPAIPPTQPIQATLVSDLSNGCLFYQCVATSFTPLDPAMSCTTVVAQHLVNLLSKYQVPNPCLGCLMTTTTTASTVSETGQTSESTSTATTSSTISSTSTTTPASTDRPYFETFTSSYVPNGEAQVGITSAFTCVTTCKISPGCYAADFNFGTNVCYFHEIVTGCNTAQTKAACSHYKLKQCPTTTTPRSTTTTTPATTTINVTPKPLTGMHIPNGALKSNLKTAAECAATCQTYQNSVCSGVDFDTAGNLCYFHSALTECNTLVPLATNTHYRFISCATGNCAFQAFPISHIIGGRVVSSGGTQAECEAACCSSTTCAGYDYNTSDKTCWTHFIDTCSNTLTIKAGCMHFSRVGACPVLPTFG